MTIPRTVYFQGNKYQRDNLSGQFNPPLPETIKYLESYVADDKAEERIRRSCVRWYSGSGGSALWDNREWNDLVQNIIG